MLFVPPVAPYRRLGEADLLNHPNHAAMHPLKRQQGHWNSTKR